MPENLEVIKAKIDKRSGKLRMHICHFLSQRAYISIIFKEDLRQEEKEGSSAW